jgi:DNA polymerase-3 subunit alpha
VDLFGKDNFFIELQDHSIAEQKRINPSLVRLAKELGVGVVATNDIHYIKKEDAKYQDVLMCIQMRKTIEDEDRMNFETQEFYYGQAQKWINMCLKYLSMLDHSLVENHYEYFHVPIDNYIVDTTGIKLYVAWSRLDDYNEYLKFQKSFRRLYD